MGIVLTVLEPPHPPEPNLVAALPPGIGRVIDVEPRLVSPRYDTLLVTTRGLVARDHSSGDFHGVPWVNFSVENHLRQHSRHATVILWLSERRPVELAITRRVALNIASVAPMLRQHPTVEVDNIVLADRPPDVVDLREPSRVGAPAPPPDDRVDGIPPPVAVSLPANQRRDADVREAGPTPDRRRMSHVAAGVAILIMAGVVGGVASLMVNTDDSPADGAVPMIRSEAVEVDQFDP